MKKGLFESYAAGIMDTNNGEKYSKILYYFMPEYISALLLYSLLFWVDSYFISQLESTAAYATLGATNNLIHFITKLAEAFSGGAIIMTGQFNGMQEYSRVGRTLRDTFWVTCIIGFFISGCLYLGAYHIYLWYDVPAEIAQLGVPFMQLRAIGIFFSFLYMAFVGFLRGIKNTRTPMYTFVIGSIAFVFFDYALIFGEWGFPRMELQGSALASVIQYAVMFVAVLIAVVFNPDYRKYGITLFSGVWDIAYARQLINLSWPILIDKTTLAWAYIWLCKMINPMGTCSVAAFCVIKDMERFAFLPAIALAQVITLLVSNDYGGKNWLGIKNNIKKVCFLSTFMVAAILLIMSINPEWFIKFFDKRGEFTPMAAYAFPILSVLVLFDLVQLILSGALRGAGNVRIVMWVRLAICIGYFVPVSYFISQMNIIDPTMKFILVYGAFYVGNAFMSIAYIIRLRGEKWKSLSVKEAL